MVNIKINTREELFAHAQAMETEAVERYKILAEQMETHNNPKTAGFFWKMARIEELHTEKILQKSGVDELPHFAPWEFQWPDGESPEAILSENTHYLMTPYHALEIVMKSEQRAVEFYSKVVEFSDPGELHKLAEELLGEELEHVELIKKWLEKTPKPEDDWDFDDDPENYYE